MERKKLSSAQGGMTGGTTQLVSLYVGLSKSELCWECAASEAGITSDISMISHVVTDNRQQAQSHTMQLHLQHSPSC